MSLSHLIRKDMEIFGTDGKSLGRVDKVGGGRIKLKNIKQLGHSKHHHYLSTELVKYVDDNVHLSVRSDRAVAEQDEG